jgi:hypothetical protein
LRALRADPELARIPVLMLTAVNQAFPLGFGPGDIDDHWPPVTDFLEKPVELNVLRAHIGSLLSGGDKGGACP